MTRRIETREGIPDNPPATAGPGAPGYYLSNILENFQCLRFLQFPFT
jgi:hypothetical protein